MWIRKVVRSTRLRVSFVFWVMALHSYGIGLILILHPAIVIRLLGFQSVGEDFFPVQGGVFHVIMSVLYALAAVKYERLVYLVFFCIVVKAGAAVFLFSYFVFADPIPVVLAAGVGDGAFALAARWAFNSYKRHQLTALSSVMKHTN